MTILGYKDLFERISAFLKISIAAVGCGLFASISIFIFLFILSPRLSDRNDISILVIILPLATYGIFFLASRHKGRQRAYDYAADSKLRKLLHDAVSVFRNSVLWIEILGVAIIVLFISAVITPSSWRMYALIPLCIACALLSIEMGNVFSMVLKVEAISFVLGISARTLRARMKMYTGDQLFLGTPLTPSFFCPVLGDTCDRVLFSRGRRSCFVAFAFAKGPISKRVRKLCKALQSRGIDLLVADKMKRDNYLLCKICEAIAERNNFIGEITLLNSNVFFEYGFAKGLGKRSWLLLDTAYADNSLYQALWIDKLQYRDWHPVKTAIQISNEIEDRQERDDDERNIAERNVIGHKLAPKRGTHRIAVIPSTPFCQLTHQSSPAAEYTQSFADKLIANSDGLIEQISLEQRFVHKMTSLMNILKGKDIIIGIFSSDTTSGSKELNCVISFFLGVALGIGLQVRFFQIGYKSHPPTDLVGVTRLVEKQSEILESLRDVHRC